ncbi:MAG: hypothetical protein J7J78_01365 [Thermoprotei archaeon]|nr:hypothetical protein [Thermoprotei archaeon]
MVHVVSFRLETLRNRFEKWLFSGRKGYFEGLAVVKIAKMLYPEEIRLLRSRKCPWCGRYFATYAGLVVHLKSKSCGWQLWSMENHVLEVYVELKQKLEEIKHRKRGRGNYKLASSEGIVYRFKHITEAAAFYVNHVLKVAQHG